MTAAEQFIEGWPTATSMPKSYCKLIEALESPSSTTGILSRIISQDSSLTNRLLKMINSPLYGFPHTIKDIPQALVILDNNQLRDLVEIISIVESFKNESTDQLMLRDFWKFSLANSMAAESLAASAGKKCSERLFAAAFLYGVGRLVMATAEPEKMKEAEKVSIKKRILLWEAEKEIFGFDHSELGGHFLRKWNSPSPVVDISLYYQRPSLSVSFKTEAHLLRLAVTITQSLRIGSCGDYFVLPVLQDTWSETGLKPSVIKDCVSQLKAQYKPMLKAFLG